MKMSQIIRDYMDEKGFLKNVIAKKCGMDRQKFYRVLSGNQVMTVEDYELICLEGLEMEPSYFFKQKLSKNENKKSA